MNCQEYFLDIVNNISCINKKLHMEHTELVSLHSFHCGDGGAEVGMNQHWDKIIPIQAPVRKTWGFIATIKHQQCYGEL
jgi:hypothetical protein